MPRARPACPLAGAGGLPAFCKAANASRPAGRAAAPAGPAPRAGDGEQKRPSSQVPIQSLLSILMSWHACAAQGGFSGGRWRGWGPKGLLPGGALVAGAACTAASPHALPGLGHSGAVRLRVKATHWAVQGARRLGRAGRRGLCRRWPPGLGLSPGRCRWPGPRRFRQHVGMRRAGPAHTFGCCAVDVATSFKCLPPCPLSTNP